MINAVLLELAQNLCRLLDGDWLIDRHRLEDGYPGIFINCADGRCLHISIPWNRENRYEIEGSFEYGLAQHLPYMDQREKTSITVSQNKSVEQIVQDITKRLLPAYERVLAQAKENKAAHDKREQDKQYALEIIQSILGDAHIRNDECYAMHKNVTARYYSTGDISLKMTVPFAKATEILKLL